MQINTDLLLIITSTADGLSEGTNIDDLERFRMSKRVLVNFSRFQAATHISGVNCVEIIEDRPRQPAHKIISIKRRF